MTKQNTKKVIASLWLCGKIPKSDLKKAFTKEEIKDLVFGRGWGEEVLDEIRG